MGLSSRSSVDSTDRNVPSTTSIDDGSFETPLVFCEASYPDFASPSFPSPAINMSEIFELELDTFGPDSLDLFMGLNSSASTAENSGLDVSQGSEKSKSAERSQKGVKRKYSTQDCRICTKSFPSLRTLGDHMLRLHNIKIFKCENCEYESSRGDNVRVHQRKCKAVPKEGIGAPKRHRVSMKSLTKSPATTDLGTAPETTSGLSLENDSSSEIHKRVTHETTPGPRHSNNSDSDIANSISRDILNIPPTDIQLNIRPVDPEISGPGVYDDRIGKLIDKILQLEEENKQLKEDNERLKEKIKQSKGNTKDGLERLRKELEDSQFEASLWKRTSLELHSSYRGIV
ncbi:hypothetical protein TWF569_011245 [Orbilia oligospora]|uniref:C2H2-type domain-containing protein n=1 Tax=Orbilia oligospora TaxID=2813651 RepID=A0A7C8NYV4_ORBOL|nr:hypothetical protein TWF706_011350 [Orbilia oligospora]KAF3096113.1 hypothetical protein TWF102_006741 [Orbilia oligospora]KAF3117155.1 hypothetical protein TWF103_007308 [Orbilia oligospora]KAF3120629.1 hypothetical protein TWF703_002394 [Orbilia oligospora]KAF3154581.1 hypothetical protein TWF569_011245 [Orbilia oligospora]